MDAKDHWSNHVVAVERATLRGEEVEVGEAEFPLRESLKDLQDFEGCAAWRDGELEKPAVRANQVDAERKGAEVQGGRPRSRDAPGVQVHRISGHNCELLELIPVGEGGHSLIRPNSSRGRNRGRDAAEKELFMAWDVEQLCNGQFHLENSHERGGFDGVA